MSPSIRILLLGLSLFTLQTGSYTVSSLAQSTLQHERSESARNINQIQDVQKNTTLHNSHDLEHYKELHDENHAFVEPSNDMLKLSFGTNANELVKYGQATYFFRCPELSYSAFKFRWKVVWNVNEPKLTYSRVEHIGEFVDMQQWGTNPIDYSASFNFNYCKDFRWRQQVCSYRMSGSFEGSMYTHIGVSTMTFITGKHADASKLPQITEICGPYYGTRSRFDHCPSSPGTPCQVMYVRVRV